MKQIPRAALVLSVLGLIPFVWGAVTVMSPDLGLWAQKTLGGRFTGPYIQLFYGAVILSFLSGTLWGFATKSKGELARASYALSVIPAIWAFFMTGYGPTTAAMNLSVGFLGALLLDWHFWRNELAPIWWMHLRMPVTAVVVITFLPLLF